MHGSEPLLILAGAGSGKTRAITSRIAWLVAEKGFDPASILAVTFTNKAANEMRERVLKMEPRTEKTIIRTFHSFGAWILRRNSEAAGLQPNFTIYDDDDQVSLLSRINSGVTGRVLRDYMHRIARAKDNNIYYDDDSLDMDGQLRELYRGYEQRLREIGNVDFGDLVLMPLRLLRSRPEIRNRLRQRFRAILVDEYQDTNVCQAELLGELCGEGKWLCVVGDDDQSIYGFRGARVGNILDFPEMFPGTRIIKLEQNYRSTGYILKAASELVSRNSGRLDKNLWTAGETGQKPRCVYLDDSDNEALWCAGELVNPEDWAKTAILYRTNAQSRAFETILRQNNIPYRLVGSISFYQREEVKNVLAFLAFLANPLDEISFRRIANKPPRGLGKIRIDGLVGTARELYSGNIAEAMKEAGFSGRAAAACRLFGTLFRRYAGEPDFENLGLLITDMINYTGLYNYYETLDLEEHSQRVANMNELVTLAADYPSDSRGLCAFLELVDLDRSAIEDEGDSSQDKVTLITVHNTKGLEFERVIVTGMEEGLFPHCNSSNTEKDIEEERRLFYVAITRAMSYLAFTSCTYRMLWGRSQRNVPSRFLEDIPVECLDVEGERPSEDVPEEEWRPGLRIYHDDYGMGVVQKKVVRNGHVTVRVSFESGRSAVFIPEFSSHKLEILDSSDR